MQGEVAALREALSDAVAFAEDALLELPQSYVKKYRLTEDAAGFKKALASDAGVQEAAVIAASIALRENELMTEENSGMSEWSLADAAGCLVSEWREAVDALLGKEA